MASAVKGLLAGQEMAFDEVNRQGGIFGRRLTLKILDDGFDTERTLRNVRTLVEEDKAVALMGLVGTSQAAAVLPYIAEKRVPLISVYSGSPSLRVKHHPYLFTTQASYVDELQKIVSNLVATMATRIAVVYQDNEFGHQMRPLAEKMIAAEGATVAGVRALEVAGRDAQAVVRALATDRPSAVILVAAGPAVVSFVKANRVELGVPVYTFSLSVGAATLAALGDDARGLGVARTQPFPWRATTALAREFHQVMARNQVPIDYDHFAGYINAKVVIEGLRAAGRNPTSATLVRALEQSTTLDLGGLAFSFGPDRHHGSNFVEIVVVGPSGNYMR